jgi:hypothetical protein
MPQVTRPNGLSFGDGSYIFSAPGDPNLRTGDDAASAKPGSLYLRQDTGQLYVKTDAAMWTAK